MTPASWREGGVSALQAALERILDARDRGVGVETIMRADERAAGRHVVMPGEVPWLSLDDWDPSIVVSIAGNRVRLVALLARRPGNGSFRRLIAGITAAGLRPTVVEPSHEMRATLKRWGWRSRYSGQGFHSEEIWYPRRTILSSLHDHENGR